MTPEAYWKLKYLLAEVELNRTKAEKLLELVDLKKAAAMREAGLDPQQVYRLDDDGFRAIPVPSPDLPTSERDTISVGRGADDGTGSTGESGAASGAKG